MNFKTGYLAVVNLLIETHLKSEVGELSIYSRFHRYTLCGQSHGYKIIKMDFTISFQFSDVYSRPCFAGRDES